MAHAFTTSSHAIEQQVVMMDGLHGTDHLTRTVHGLQLQSWDLPTMSLPNANKHPLFYIGVYSALGLGSALVGVLSAIVQYTGALRASKVLFVRLLVTVVRATMRWHDTTPQGTLPHLIFFHLATALTVVLLGRMLNRFSKVRKVT
jgi:hypothetical protein